MTQRNTQERHNLCRVEGNGSLRVYLIYQTLKLEISCS